MEANAARNCQILKADTVFTSARPFGYSSQFGSHPFPYITRFHTNRVLKLQDALLTSYHRHEGDKYYGAKATMNVVTQDPAVHPDLYGDNNTRLFTYWTSDAYQATGCYNLLCSGFIQVNSDIAMGASISPVSDYQGSQYDINILIWKDPNEGNWWMQFGSDYVLGYWPAFLFSYLADNSLQEKHNKDITLQEAEIIALSILKQVMEKKVTPNNVDITQVTYRL